MENIQTHFFIITCTNVNRGFLTLQPCLEGWVPGSSYIKSAPSSEEYRLRAPYTVQLSLPPWSYINYLFGIQSPLAEEEQCTPKSFVAFSIRIDFRRTTRTGGLLCVLPESNVDLPVHGCVLSPAKDTSVRNACVKISKVLQTCVLSFGFSCFTHWLPKRTAIL